MIKFSQLIADIEGIPGDIGKFFSNPKVDAAIKEAATLAIDAQPYVAEIEAITAPLVSPAGVLTEAAVTAAYNHYAVPLLNVAMNTPAQLGNALLNLATMQVAKLKPSATTTAINTGVQLATTALRASMPVPALHDEDAVSRGIAFRAVSLVTKISVKPLP
jgi:hypothetical protein